MTKRLAFMLAVSLGIGGLGACAGTTYGGGGAGYASVTVRSAELVTLDEDVYVLADADEPVFYTDGHYWLYRDNSWYRSRSYDRGWVQVREPAPRVRRISEPTAYIRYRARHQEARNVPRPAQSPTRDPWRDEYDRRDAPSTLPPHAQPPLQPTQPQQPAHPYPRPPQQEPAPHTDHGADHRIDAPIPDAPVTPSRDIRRVPPGHDNRPATPPGQDRERVKPQPPAGGAEVTPPGPPANHDVRTPDRDRRESNRAREDHPPTASPPARGNSEHSAHDDKRKQEKSDKRDR